jgi:hypothetical protein
MPLNKKHAAYLLLNYPALSEWLENRRKDILQGSRQGVFAGGNRGSGHSDPTARKAVLLLEDRHIRDMLEQVSQWIDTGLEPADRPLLLMLWRLKTAGWYLVAKCLGWEVLQCRGRWETMTNNLTDHLSKNVPSVGVAYGLHGGVYAGGQMNTSREL